LVEEIVEVAKEEISKQWSEKERYFSGTRVDYNLFHENFLELSYTERLG